MPTHKLNAYIERDRTRVVFCDICGQDNPTGECPGDLVANMRARHSTTLTQNIFELDNANLYERVAKWNEK